ncbi:hypothetical protein K469DRAFT_721703 [Zopfia rhizophila CBS 207.26]|uniref:Mus7/MMS22 family-domain-containing protein n=1 Tax=Zopfia rhizophila CBS 207.26 TaxID=1314779 RepID=A0A6A6EFG9_9PEZI|nr:hypothetical protein K469DRAFT_721703 [Zopfia rhizophila CBS 207.26]
MSEWRLRGYVQDSDEEEEDLETLSTNSSPTSQLAEDGRVAVTNADPAPLQQETELTQDVSTQPPFSKGRVTPVEVSENRPEPESTASIQTSPPRQNQNSRNEATPSRNVDISDLLRLRPLSESSQSDDELSEPPPSDQEPVIFALPKRQVDVQVVIPPSNSIEQDTLWRRASRSLRTRRPIQLHPYLLEGERYRRECQDRGLKPVPRVRSPPPRAEVENEEMQENEFDPEDGNPSSSPPDVSRSTPLGRRPWSEERHMRSISHSISGSTQRKPRRDQHTCSRKNDAGGTARIKRHKLIRPSTQREVSPERIEDDDGGTLSANADIEFPSLDDIFTVPLSPPYSSSPLVNTNNSAIQKPVGPIVSTPLPDLPTPIISSGTRNPIRYLTEPDSENGSPERSAGEQPRPIRSNKSSPDSGSSDHEPDESESQMKHVRKRIRGVLPASWLRLDLQAQQKRKAQANEQRHPFISPEKTEPQRGVAQKIMRHRRSLSNRSPAKDSSNLIVISDESDNESNPSLQNNLEGVWRAADVASQVASRLDKRYTDDDLDHMENDRLHLFTLGGNTRKRKRELKLIDAFGKPDKKMRTWQTDLKASGISIERRVSRKPTHRKLTSRRHKQIGPALSIIDAQQTTTVGTEAVPQFIRLAIRQAQRLPDRGRQSPSNKYIRLQTSVDTEDANLSLRQWRNGDIKSHRSHEQSSHHQHRRPLADLSTNQQWAHKPLIKDVDSAPQPGTQESGQNPLIFCRTSGRPTQPTQVKVTSSPSKKHVHCLVHHNSPSYRSAQLEGLESEFSRNIRKLTFEKELWRVDQQFIIQRAQNHPSRNLQLARYLADDDQILPPLQTAEDTTEVPESPTRNISIRKRRIVRKHRAQRIDAEAREYRQPGEPTLESLFHDVPVDLTAGEEHQILQGLGPFGTRYSANFDVCPLQIGTFFHSDTFIGSEEFQRSLRIGQRDLDVFSGYYSIWHNGEKIECGPWTDEVFSRISGWTSAIWQPLEGQDYKQINATELSSSIVRMTKEMSKILRSLIVYFSASLSFLDVIDRREFVLSMKRWLETLSDKVLRAHGLVNPENASALDPEPQTIRTMIYLLVLSVQVYRVAQHTIVDASVSVNLLELIKCLSKLVVKYLIRKGMVKLQTFLEDNKYHRTREGGVQDDEVLAESVVICMRLLQDESISGETFWTLVSDELAQRAKKAVQLATFESTWASAFTLLPFVEFDVSGVLHVNRRFSLADENWAFIRDLLKRLFVLYPETFKTRGASLNAYVRASLTRCHVLIKTWNWKKCDVMLSTVFDFFGKNGLRQLQCEESKGSPLFLEQLADKPSLDVEPDDSAFHIFLKCLALGLKGMLDLYPQRKIRSIVLRCTPNHGRNYPKDQDLEREDLDALRNHHDLLCTLYWASPASCRPKVDVLRGLVQHESSHREACRLNVRAWASLTAFQLSTNEPYTSLQPFALWHRETIQQTLKQYRLAKTEAEDYFRIAQQDGTSDISAHLVRLTIDNNQTQVIATLRDSIEGMRNAIKYSREQDTVKKFLTDSGIVQLLELFDVDDPRLTAVIRETLTILKQYATLKERLLDQEESQKTSEESQDYGEFPDLDDFEDIGKQDSKERSLDFIQTPLWHLLSNSFGAESPPDDNLLMDCIDTWVLIARSQVSTRERSWAEYIDSFSHISWHQLLDTDQTRKFSPYFMSSLMTCDPNAYEEHRQEFMTAWLLCLVVRESMLRFQFRFTNAIVQVDPSHPLLQNLPFVQDAHTGQFDITAETLRTRRLALISSVLANMRDDVHRAMLEDPDRAAETKREYAAMLKKFMVAMKNNYQELQQGSTVIGAYVEFVQKIVQFLKQYTSDICLVDSFFTDSVAFPLPATDPTYVVGRLCGYAPKLANPGVAKQLATFMQTITQQAAFDNQQPYLIDQLSTAMSNPREGVSSDTPTVRQVLLQGIFPAYIDAAFHSTTGLVISRPLLQALKSVFSDMFFDLRVTDIASVQSTTEVIASFMYTVFNNAEALILSASLLGQPHVLNTIALALDAVATAIPILDYISDRTERTRTTNPFITYLEQFGIFVAEHLHNLDPYRIPCFDGIPNAPAAYMDVLAFTTKELKQTMVNNWEEHNGKVFFGRNLARREVIVNIGTVEEEKANVVSAIENFHRVLASLKGEGREREFMADVVV